MAVRLGQLSDMVDPTTNDRSHLIHYEVTGDTFALKDINDTPLNPAVEDNDLPDDFVTQLESQIEVDKITLRSFDGGSF